MPSVLTTPDIALLDIDSLADEPPVIPPPDQAHVWVLIDGDQCIFDPEAYLNRGEEGGRAAAKMIAEFVHQEFGERTDYVLLIYVFWNLGGLMYTLEQNNRTVTWPNMRRFIQGFQHPPFNYCIDTGKGKESADSKLHALFRDNLRSHRTKHMFVGFSDDHGYDTEFRKEVVEKFSSRIGLIKGHKYSHPPMTLQCRSHEIKGLFLEERLLNQHDLAGELQRSPSSVDNWREANVPATPDRSQGVSLPSSPQDSSKPGKYIPPNKRNSSTAGSNSAFGHFRRQSISSPLGFPSSKLSSPRSVAGSLDYRGTAPLAPASPTKSDTLLLGVQDSFSPGASIDNSRQTPVLPAELFRTHSMICPSIDGGNPTFSPTSCTDASRCSYKHRCPFGSECVLRKVGVCNFPEGLEEVPVEQA